MAVQQQHIAVPRRFSTFAREVWQFQPRLINRQPRSILRDLSHKRFRAAFDFVCLRGLEDDALKDCGEWWEKIQEVDADEQQAMIDELPRGDSRRRRPKRKRGGNRPSQAEG